MKIWCQSCTSLEQDENFKEYTECVKKYAQEIARPDTILEFHGVDEAIPELSAGPAPHSLCVYQSIRNAFRAEREGYDAFVMINALDNGYYEIKQALNIPVAFITETALHIAMMFAPKFAFLAHQGPFLLQIQELAERYGVDKHMIPGGYLGTDLADLPNIFRNPNSHVDVVKTVAREIIARGADILVPGAGCVNMFLHNNGIREIDGALVLNTLGCVVKIAELMVDMQKIGITRSRHGMYAALSKEALATINKFYEWEK